MKISSKSILSPGRAMSRDPSISLSTSLSRKLRTSGSIKGGASPAMFPTAGKKRGAGFENPEPSSPKVTCIGQVRVKSKKKQGKRLRSLSRRHSIGEVSFRKLEHSRDGFGSRSQNQHQSQSLGSNYQQGSHNHPQNQECLQGQRSNQRWVHLPLTICEALRTFGSEFSCLFPCRSSCFSTTERDKEEKMGAAGGDSQQGSCSAAFARWLVALHDGDGGGKEVELDLEDDHENEEERDVMRPRRHVFEDLEILDKIEANKDEARVSICIPPKNALLLMRCRSDPVKLETLANRYWEPNVAKNEEFVDDEEIVHLKEPQEDLQVEQQKKDKFVVLDKVNDQEHDSVQDDQEETHLKMDIEQSIEKGPEEKEQIVRTNEEEEEEEEEEREILFLGSLFEETVYQCLEFQENEAHSAMEEAHEKEDDEIGAVESTIEKVKDSEEKDVEEMVNEFTERSLISEETHEEEEVVTETEELGNGVLEREIEVKEERESSKRVLPECLLMMLCEPKLSMEVSKETWVCSRDFIRRRSDKKKPPPPPPVKSDDGQEESKMSEEETTATTLDVAITHDTIVIGAAMAAGRLQPARSSCSLPAAPSMAKMIEQKLVNAMGYEPFVLTRCKSEPMRTAAAKLAPESCFWENKQLEPLRRAAFGVGEAGLGF